MCVLISAQNYKITFQAYPLKLLFQPNKPNLLNFPRMYLEGFTAFQLTAAQYHHDGSKWTAWPMGLYKSGTT